MRELGPLPPFAAARSPIAVTVLKERSGLGTTKPKEIVSTALEASNKTGTARVSPGIGGPTGARVRFPPWVMPVVIVPSFRVGATDVAGWPALTTWSTEGVLQKVRSTSVPGLPTGVTDAMKT